MDTFTGLPAHPLFVHVVLVAVPLAGLIAIVSVLWPRARRWLGPTPAIASLIALIVLPITTSAGETLEHKLGEPSEVLEQHTHYGDMVILWVGPMFGLAALWWILTTNVLATQRGRFLGDGAQRWATILVGVLTVLVAVGAIFITLRVGHLGAQAVWGSR